jgi:hypothetical protein
VAVTDRRQRLAAEKVGLGEILEKTAGRGAVQVLDADGAIEQRKKTVTEFAFRCMVGDSARHFAEVERGKIP